MAFEPDIPPIQVHLCANGTIETFALMAEDGGWALLANLAMFGSVWLSAQRAS